MVADLKDDAADEITRALVIERVQEKIDAGTPPPEAFVAVFEEIKLAGRIEDLALIHGHRLVAELWRSWNIAHRPAAVARTLSRPITPGLITAVSGDVIPPAPPARVVDLRLVRETLDSQYIVNGRYVLLRHMKETDCLNVAEQYRDTSIAAEHKSRHMRAIAHILKDGGTVEEKLTERELMRLWRITEPPGNTLA